MSIFDYCFSFSHPFSPSGIHHPDKIALSSLLTVFCPDFHLSLFAFSFVCGTKWAKVGPLSAVQGIDSVARLQSGDLKTHCESRWLGRGVRKKSVPFRYQGSRWLLFNILLLSFLSICLKSVSLELWIFPKLFESDFPPDRERLLWQIACIFQLSGDDGFTQNMFCCCPLSIKLLIF